MGPRICFQSKTQNVEMLMDRTWSTKLECSTFREDWDSECVFERNDQDTPFEQETVIRTKPSPRGESVCISNLEDAFI